MMKSSYMRLNGKRVDHKDRIDTILKLLKDKPLTPTELAQALGLTREHLSRRYLYPLVKDGKVEKIEGTNKYKLVNQNYDARKAALIITSEDEFYNCETIQRWLKHANKVKHEMRAISTFRRLCLGEITSEFKINPDRWMHPETTEQVVDILLRHFNKVKLPSYIRSCIRRFIKFGLGLPLGKDEALELGITGAKDSIGNYADVSFTKEQYERAKQILKNEPKIVRLKFWVKFWTFARPSTIYTIELDNIEFYDRKVTYIELPNGRKITDNQIIELLKDRYGIKEKIERACRLKVFEFKTQRWYQKRIYDDEVVRELEDYVNDRRSKGYRYLFYDDNKNFEFETYDRLVKYLRVKDGNIFKEIFKKIGCRERAFYEDTNYAFRHIGVQHWLQATNYDYDFVAEMGWEDINTLRQWYGKMSKEHFDKTVEKVLFS
ncbi:MAG: hypothetical protein KatS3mg003_1161 [Candidatus Nitrosocaldaceae archaeon]|nr:MAG: hypothetical protein KatS3mg003_1161 [Candidatus Nitrosocaldaceae archaeon]